MQLAHIHRGERGDAEAALEYAVQAQGLDVVSCMVNRSLTTWAEIDGDDFEVSYEQLKTLPSSLRCPVVFVSPLDVTGY